MASSSVVEPRRLALRFVPPGIIVEYALRSKAQLYHHEISLQDMLTSTVLSESRVNEIVQTLFQQHNHVFGDRKVSTQQLSRLVKKLSEQNVKQNTTAPTLLPQADYNRVSESQLKQVKMKMDVMFQQNVVRPGQEGYQYDKQVVFNVAEEVSDWDD